jgi:DNA polymerase III gamma/tau subunit
MTKDEQPTELYRKYRPKSFRRIIGQDNAVSIMQGWLSKNKTPHAVLLVGHSGCGKTTLARILAKQLKCEPPRDLFEINAANFNGIDTVRDIQRIAQSGSLLGKEHNRCWIIDECFHADTLVKTINGNKRIADIQVNDHVYSAIGKDTVIKKYVNRVPLERVCCVTYEGYRTFVSKDHLYFTNRGWIKAIDLQQNDLLYKLTKIPIRVEGVEIYESENTDQSKWGIITEQDRNRGFVEFYDLEISEHHSYFANDVLVHNCHQLSTQAQQGMLKLLEEAPSYAYFFLCTTDPQKLIPTIKNRCSEIKLNPVPITDLIELCSAILERENVSIDESVLEQLAVVSDGSPRKCLVKLEQLIELPNDKLRLKSLEKDESFNAAIKDLCNVFTRQSKKSWKEVAKIVKSIGETNEPESIRYAVLGWLNSALLGGWAHGVSNEELVSIMNYWMFDFYTTKSAGVSIAAFSSWSFINRK